LGQQSLVNELGLLTTPF